jgi:hypothetical protein
MAQWAGGLSQVRSPAWHAIRRGSTLEHHAMPCFYSAREMES